MGNMYKSNLNYSSFWLDRSIWEEDDEVTKVEKKSKHSDLFDELFGDV